MGEQRRPGNGQPRAKSISLTVGAALTLLGVVTGAGQPVIGHLFDFLEFYAGVFTLVSLTLTVIAGLVATDRMLLLARHRMWVQSIHRTLGIVAVSCLVLHVATEIAGGRVNAFGAVVPFVASRFQIGLGTLAAYLMMTVMWSGIVRARFASREKAWMWRPLHATAYLSWPVALWHGLNTGRPAAVWVTASYLVLVLFTLVALGLRLSAESNHRTHQKSLDRTTVAVAPMARSKVTWDASAGPVWDAPTSERPVYDRPPATYEPEPDLDRVPQDVYWSQREATGRVPVEYPADETPTLVNLDSQRSLRRTPKTSAATARRASGTKKGKAEHDVTDEGYWAVLRGEAG